MAEEQGDKLLHLCRHIADNGLNPAQDFIVLEDDKDRFIVLDANRRLTALRVLDQPNLLEHHISNSMLRHIKQLAESYEPIEQVSCVVVNNREDADQWIELTHEGELQGAGLVPWSAQQKTRHRSRRGVRAPHLQVLDYVRQNADEALTPSTIGRIDQGRFPVSTLERALTTPHVRDQLGIEFRDGRALTRYPQPEVLKGLTKLVDEIGSRKVNVNRLKSSADRTSYVDSFTDRELPDPNTLGTDPVPLDEAPETPQTTRRRPRRRPSTSRRTLIPPAFTIDLDPNEHRINEIYVELKRKLKVDDTPNAAGVLLRVFLELSIDAYIRKHKVNLPRKKTLANKVISVTDFMEDEGMITSGQFVQVREAVKSDDKVTLATNLNALAHSPDMTVSGSELKALWNRLQTFFGKLWNDQ